jgi:ribosomal protein S12 methylthiotransferase
MKIGFVSLGCPKNLVDSEVMLGMAEKEGHEITADASQADVLVVNTCAFIDRAKQESIDTILEMADLKKQAAGRKLIVTGCLAERYRDELRKEIPEIDAVYGTGEVPDFVGGLVPGAKPLTLHRQPPVFGVDLPTYIYDAGTPRKRVTPGHYAYVKIEKAATTSARSASSRKCAGTIAAGRSTRSSRKQGNLRRKG